MTVAITDANTQLVDQLIGETEVDGVSPRLMKYLYDRCTKDVWLQIISGVTVIAFWSKRFNACSDIEILISNLYFSMWVPLLNKICTVMIHKHQTCLLITHRRMNAFNIVMRNDIIMDRIVNINRRVKAYTNIWYVAEIESIIFRALFSTGRGFSTYLLELQRRICNCQCTYCTGSWNNPTAFLLSCSCTCPLCEPKQWNEHF